MRTEWNTFTPGVWQHEINVRDFIQKTTPPTTAMTPSLKGLQKIQTALWNQVMELSAKEREAGGVLDMDTKIIPPLRLMAPDTWIKIKKPLWASRQTNPLSGRCSLTAVSAWQ